MAEIVFEKVGKSFGSTKVIEDLDLTIEDGKFTVLVGSSGCGKTTLLRMIAGIGPATSGRILMDGKDITHQPPEKRDIAMVFQNYAIYPTMSVRENIEFGLKNKKVPKEERDRRIKEYAEIVGMTPYLDRKPSDLSGGQRQRIALARAMVKKPSVFLMDEPLSNLDAKLRGEMRTELKRLHTDTNSTFVYVTHDQLEAMTLSTKVCLMETGVLQQYAPPLEIYNKPANTFVASFVGNPTMNFIPVQVEGVQGEKAQLSVLGKKAVFTAEGALEKLGKTATLGVRPEFLPIREQGALTASIYSTLPAGMETTVKATCGDTMLTSVVFGSVDYAVDAQVHMDIIGHDIVLFEDEGHRSVGVGTLEFA